MQETYQEIKDRLEIQKDYSILNIACFACEQVGHLVKDCELVQYKIGSAKEVIDIVNT